MATRPTSRRIKDETVRILEGRVTRRTTRSLPDAIKKELLEKDVNIQRDPEPSTLPPINFTGKTYYVTDFEGCATICDQILERIEKFTDKEVPIGFDLEWPFSFQTGSGKTALAQVCVSINTCHLFHIYNLKKLPASFTLLLSHPRVKLVGVNIKNDIWKLGRDFSGFPAQKVVENNCVDCGPLANTIYKRSCRWSMEKLTAYILSKQISKDDSVRKSKWHILPLSEAQKSYAATDAYVSLLLYITIIKKAESLAVESQKNDLKVCPEIAVPS